MASSHIVTFAGTNIQWCSIRFNSKKRFEIRITKTYQNLIFGLSYHRTAGGTIIIIIIPQRAGEPRVEYSKQLHDH